MKDKNEMIMQKTVVVWLGALLCCLLWGSAVPCVKIGYRLFEIASSDYATQIIFAGYRFTLGGVLAVIIGSVSAKKVLLPQKGSWKRIVTLAMVQTVLQYYFYYTGLANTSGVKSAIITSMNVFIAILIASLIFHQEKLTMIKILGCILGFSGVVLINMDGMDLQINPQGEGRIVVSTVAYALSSVLLKKFSGKDEPFMLSGYQFMLGGIVLSIIGLAMGGRLQVFTPASIMILVYLALVSAVAYSVWAVLLKYNTVSRVTVFGFMNPVFGVLLSTILLKEDTQINGMICILSLVLVCIGIYIVNRPQKKGV